MWIEKYHHEIEGNETAIIYTTIGNELGQIVLDNDLQTENPVSISNEFDDNRTQ